MRRRALLLGFAAVAAMAGPPPVAAEATVSIVVGYTAGGTTDTIARILATRLGEKLGTSVIVENRPGATGQIASRAVARSEPDGHVIMIATQTTHAVAPSLYRSPGYQPLTDFTPITLAAWTPLVLVTNPSFPAQTLKELVAYLKERPGETRYATGGRGDGSHIASLFFNKMAGVTAVAVPFQGEGPAMPAVLAGHVPYMFCSAPTVASVIGAGGLKALASTSRTRSDVLPDVPTVAEQGYEGYEMVNWWGFFGPANMPPDVVARLNGALNEILTEPATRERLGKLGYVVTGSTADDFRRFLAAENAKWAEVIASQGLTPQ